MFPVKPIERNLLDQLLQEVISEIKGVGISVGSNISTHVVVNSRAKKRLGACKKTYIDKREHFTIEVANALLVLDPLFLREVLVHEVLHTCHNCMNHGKEWKSYAKKMNKEYGYNIQRLASAKVL